MHAKALHDIHRPYEAMHIFQDMELVMHVHHDHSIFSSDVVFYLRRLSEGARAARPFGPSKAVSFVSDRSLTALGEGPTISNPC